MFIDGLFPRSFPILFAEFVGRMRTTFPIWAPDSLENDSFVHPEEDAQVLTVGIKADSSELTDVSALDNPEPWFIRMVEDSLRKLPDFIALGQLPLTDCVGMKGGSHISRGKQLHQLLHAGIESLRPAGTRPVSAPSRDWYNYIILHDAYLIGITNREVMAKLYISEGTFNRTRRNALRGVAIYLIEGMGQRGIE